MTAPVLPKIHARDDAAQTSAEYAVVLAVLTLMIVPALMLLSGHLAGVMVKLASALGT